MSLPAIILAAGASRRLGQPKQLVVVAGETLLGRTLRATIEAGANPVVVVLGAEHERIAQSVDLAGCQMVVNPDWERGIAGSIRLGLRTVLDVAPRVDACLLLVCDQPYLSSDHLRALMREYSGSVKDQIIASLYAGIWGIPAIFPRSRFTDLFALSGDNGARSLMRGTDSPPIAVLFQHGEIDVDTPDDLSIV